MDDATRLAEAKAALHDLLRGQGVRELQDQNGERVAYHRADIPRLRAYIAELEDRETNAPGGPLTFVF